MHRAFAGFELDEQRSRLLRDGKPIDLEPKAFELLCYLIRNPHRLISKQELKREVWQAQRLSDGVTANAIAKLRRALDQPADADAPIETVRGRGYIFHSPTGDQDELRIEEPAVDSLPSVSEPFDPFVGREATLDVLNKKLERSRRGAASVVVISGPAGIGKTRLVREFLRQVAKEQLPAWLGAGYDGDGFPPYWPWMQIVREAQRAQPSAFARSLPQGAQLISQWVSGLGLHTSSAAALDPQALRFRLFDELTRWLRSMVSSGPVLIVVDDLQWADAGSIELLGHLARALESSAVMFLCTVRADEAVSRNVEEALAKVSRVASQVRLAGLSEEESHTLVRELHGAESLSDAHLRELYQRSEGNPFFLRQFLDWWIEAGEGLERRVDLPPGARDVVRRRLCTLPSSAQRVLSAASVLGAQFRASRVARILAESTESVLEALAAGSRLTLISPVTGADEFSFTHALLQETLYQDMDLKERGALHSRAADSFGSDEASAQTGQLGERAWHLVHALPSRLEDAVRACEGAAKAAQQAAGFERASDLLRLAITKLEVEGAPLEEQARLWVELGDGLLSHADIDQAWDAYRRAAELLRAAGSSERLAMVVPLLVRCVNLTAGDAHFARDVIDEVLRTLPPHAARERGCTLAKKAQLALELSLAERDALLEEASAAADDRLLRLEVAYTRNTLRDPNTLEQNEQAAEDFLAVIEAEDQEPSAIRYRSVHLLGVHLTRYVCAAIRCDLERADRVMADLAQLAETTHLRAAEVLLLTMRAGRALAAGRLDELAALVMSPQVAANDTFSVKEAIRTYQMMLLEGRGAMAVLEKVEPPALAPGSGLVTLRQRTDLALSQAYLFVRTGRLERARSVLEQVPRSDINRMPILYGDLGVLTGLANLYAALDDDAGMRLVYDKLVPFVGRNAVLPTFMFRGAVDHYLGMLAQRLGDAGQACAHLQAAVEINRGLGMQREVAESQALLASLG